MIKLSRAALYSEALLKNSSQPKNSVPARENCTTGHPSSWLPDRGRLLPWLSLRSRWLLPRPFTLSASSHPPIDTGSWPQPYTAYLLPSPEEERGCHRGKRLTLKGKGNQKRHPLYHFPLWAYLSFGHTPSSCLNRISGVNEGAHLIQCLHECGFGQIQLILSQLLVQKDHEEESL